jgi:hypothetical protein
MNSKITHSTFNTSKQTMKKIILLSALSCICIASYGQSRTAVTPSDQPVQALPVERSAAATATQEIPKTPSASPVDVTQAKRPAKQVPTTSATIVNVPSQSPTPVMNKSSAPVNKAKRD